MQFEDLNISEPLQRALIKEGYSTPTPIQAEAIPHLLKGEDLMGIAQTGTGKTAAFVLPVLQKMAELQKVAAPGVPRALVLAPTRELAAQIDESFGTYGQFLRFSHAAVYGGVHQGPQVKALSRGVDALVATPGRLLDLMEQGHIDLKDVEFFVLDEADRMLDMGFAKDVRKIVSALPKRRHSLFFAATMSKEVGELAGRLLTDPVRIEVAPQATPVERIEQRIFFVDQKEKNPLLIGLLQQKFLKRVLVFTRTKRRADRVAKVLTKTGIRADAIHGDRTQNQRTSALGGFKAGRLQVLVATDIAARGIDVEDISHVINYDLPNEAESYVHRIGRTGRAGRAGTAYSFCSAEERSFLRDIERLTRTKIREVDHRYHSEEAKNASGAASEPAPRRTKRPPRRAGEKGVPPGRSRRPGPRR
ncbi:MAG TPA: DEAD/DEAH box helicase [Methanothrix sp.]|jgi:ATP-dependent RNA helicase RhlE|nr:DEAD/DEAH box helicase [Methanothrix sp.]OPX82110.1 MAG: putative ATP-dependent RNA helicase [Methanosaeta sp. PtaB.Bin087]HOI70585.1 DEAD/DEAH box helicase [Methanothrix sp.]HPY73496.1 DEAD/DEAH box helicase [Methanothrix sp.]HQA63154.1 DEAD/DEAH box helicase [Methanothrix sp.]